jgi:putative flippase GtrA
MAKPPSGYNGSHSLEIETSPMTAGTAQPLHERRELPQFVKFCIVGSSSFAIDYGVSYLLLFHGSLSVELSKTISFSLAVTNGYFWNRRWTFRSREHRRKREQYPMFFGVNIIGLLLNVLIVKSVIYVETGVWRNQHPTKLTFLLATIAAAGVVVFWNFFANKLWTFRPPAAPAPDV